jgi:hypothetical protein
MLTNFRPTCIHRTLVSDLGTGTGYPGLRYATYASFLSILILLIVCILEMWDSVLGLDTYPDRSPPHTLPHFLPHTSRYFICHVKCPICVSDFNQIWIFLTDFHKKSPVSNLTQIHPVGDGYIWRDRLTWQHIFIKKSPVSNLTQIHPVGDRLTWES